MKRIFSHFLLGLIIGLFLLTSASLTSATSSKKVDIELTGQNTVLLDNQINNSNLDTFAAAMFAKRMALPAEEVLYVLVVSPGGSYEASLRYIEVLKAVPNTTLICRFCASAAGSIFATYKGPRVVTATSQLLMHEMYMDHVTAKMVMNGLDMASFIQASDDFNKSLYDVLGISRQAYEARIAGTEWVLDGKDIVHWHMADKVITVDCDAYMHELAPNTCGGN